MIRELKKHKTPEVIANRTLVKAVVHVIVNETPEKKMIAMQMNLASAKPSQA